MNRPLDTLAAATAAQNIARAALAADVPIPIITIGTRLAPLALADQLSTATEPSAAHPGAWTTAVCLQAAREPNAGPTPDLTAQTDDEAVTRLLGDVRIGDTEPLLFHGAAWVIADGIAIRVY
jgi:hypothetical protein